MKATLIPAREQIPGPVKRPRSPIWRWPEGDRQAQITLLRWAVEVLWDENLRLGERVAELESWAAGQGWTN